MTQPLRGRAMPETGAVADDRRPALIAAALQSLAREYFDLVDVPVVPMPGGVGIHEPSRSFVWLDEQPERLLGAAIALHLRKHSDRLDIVVPDQHREQAPVVARRMRQWNIDSDVYLLDGRSLTGVDPRSAETEAECAFEIDEFRSIISEAGAEVVIEHGVLTGEVAGLEVCRVIFEDDWKLRVGVGSQDREAFQMLHGDAPALDSLVRVVEFVQTYRHPAADPHPLNRLSAERWMRATVLSSADSPLVNRVAMSGVLPRGSMSDAAPAFISAQLNGEHVLVACTTGTDLGAIVDAADHAEWSAHGETVTEILVAIDGRNRLPVLNEMAQRSRRPMRIVSQAELLSR